VDVFSPLVLLTVGYLMGTSSSSSNIKEADSPLPFFVSSVDSPSRLGLVIESYIVPLYSILVMVILVAMLNNEYKAFISMKEGGRVKFESVKRGSVRKSSSRRSLMNSKQSSNRQVVTEKKPASAAVAPAPTKVAPIEPVPEPVKVTPPEPKVRDLSGSYLLKKHENFEAFLIAMGAPWAGRKLVLKESPSMEIKMAGKNFHVKVTGLLALDVEYEIGGPAKEVPGKKENTTDTCTALANGAVRVEKIFHKKDMTVYFDRSLSEDGKVLTLDITSIDKAGKKVLSKNIFERT